MVVGAECRNLSAGYGKKRVLKEISFYANHGECTGIVGPNGCGKSTLMRVFTRLLQPFSGEVLVGELPISSYSPSDFARFVAYLPSHIEVTYPYTAGEFLAMGRYPFHRLFRITDRSDASLFDRVVEIFSLAPYLHTRVQDLSEGERQRLFLAQCMLQQPKILFLDEPTSHLDIGRQYRTLDLLKEFQEREGCTIIAILHDLNLASFYCDRIIMMKEGSVVSAGTPSEVLTYEKIESVYEATVLVYPHPISHKPYVFGVPEAWHTLYPTEEPR
ncbi:MAG: ABC transporter ATP-binding protein [Candidatus Ratteibacteria bacterium]|jgi:iron complex transport system ATP-binding protein